MSQWYNFVAMKWIVVEIPPLLTGSKSVKRVKGFMQINFDSTPEVHTRTMIIEDQLMGKKNIVWDWSVLDKSCLVRAD